MSKKSIWTEAELAEQSQPIAVPDSNAKELRYVRIKAESVNRETDGTFLIEFSAKMLTPAQQQLLREMFPYTIEQAEQLLDTEALISNLVKR